MMKIIQITDAHIGAKDEIARGVDVHQNFRDILLAVKKERPDVLVVTGDFCLKKPIMHAYQWSLEQLEGLSIPIHVVPGNHDDLEMMNSVFPFKTVYPYQEYWQGFRILFINSSSATFDHATENFLRNLDPEPPTLMFVHHPLLQMGVPYMDRLHSFDLKPDMRHTLLGFSNLQIFCGHYHVERSLRLSDMTIHVCPSLYMQIDPLELNFKVDHYQIAFRRIELDFPKMITSVSYLEGNHSAG